MKTKAPSSAATISSRQPTSYMDSPIFIRDLRPNQALLNEDLPFEPSIVK